MQFILFPSTGLASPFIGLEYFGNCNYAVFYSAIGYLIDIRRLNEMVTALKRYQRRRYRLKQWWVSERAGFGFGWGMRGRRGKSGYGTMPYFPDLDWD